MAATGNTYEIRLGSVLDGQNMLNVFHYQCATGTPAALNLITTFNTNVLSNLQAIVSTSMEFTTQDCINLDDLSDFWGGVYSTTFGAVSGQFLNPFVCWAFRMNRATRYVRNGAKRFAGVAESWIDNGVANSTASPYLSAAGTAMGNTLTGGGSAPTYKPVILHKQPLLVPTHVPYAISSVGYIGVSTQNTRKR